MLLGLKYFIPIITPYNFTNLKHTITSMAGTIFGDIEAINVIVRLDYND